jgi:hypothetical protein
MLGPAVRSGEVQRTRLSIRPSGPYIVTSGSVPVPIQQAWRLPAVDVRGLNVRPPRRRASASPIVPISA